MRSTRARADSGAAAAPPEQDDAIDEIELQSVILVRHFEMLRRRSDVFADVDRAEYPLLRTLDRNGPTGIGELAGLLGLDPSTAGRQVAAMAAGGLVHRTPSPADRRRSIVNLSDRGRRLMGRVRDGRRLATTDLLADWTPAQLRALAAAFTRYNVTVARRYLP